MPGTADTDSGSLFAGTGTAARYTKSVEKLPLKGGKHRRNCWICASKPRTPDFKLPVVTGRGNGCLMTEEDGEICMDFFFRGGCRYKKRCKFKHVRGQAL